MSISTLGIDISKAYLDIYYLPDELHHRYPNTASGIASLLTAIATLGSAAVDHIILEPSGGYEHDILHALQQAGLPVSRIHARQIRDYARARGVLAKTDKLDARILADYGLTMRPALTMAPPPACKTLKSLITRRDQLVQFIKQERNALETNRDPVIERMIKVHIKSLEKQMSRLDDIIANTVEQNRELTDKAIILQSCKGVGVQTANVLLAHMPELGQLDGRKSAALAGLAPKNRDSGTWRGQRTIGGGRARVRKALYMAALTASRYNAQLKSFYDKKISEGMKPKPALIAVARKLLLILNALIRDNRTWTQ